jgi:hypothetical protein
LSKLAQIKSSSFNETVCHKEEADTATKENPKKQKENRIKRLTKARRSRMHGKNKKKGIQLPSKQSKERKKERRMRASSMDGMAQCFLFLSFFSAWRHNNIHTL